MFSVLVFYISDVLIRNLRKPHHFIKHLYPNNKSPGKGSVSGHQIWVCSTLRGLKMGRVAAEMCAVGELLNPGSP